VEQTLAEELGLRNLGEIPGFPGHFLLEGPVAAAGEEEEEEPGDGPRLAAAGRSAQPRHDLTSLLVQDSR
jgi:hypothetical protein